MKVSTFAALLLAGCLSLLGQNRATLRANIPFPFEVSNKVMPAGVYTFSFLDTQSVPVVCLRDEENTLRAASASQAQWIAPNVEQAPWILFNRYSDRQFLAGMIWPGSKFVLLKSSNEKALVTSRVLQAGRCEEVRIVAQVR